MPSRAKNGDTDQRKNELGRIHSDESQAYPVAIHQQLDNDCSPSGTEGSEDKDQSQRLVDTLPKDSLARRIIQSLLPCRFVVLLDLYERLLAVALLLCTLFDRLRLPRHLHQSILDVLRAFEQSRGLVFPHEKSCCVGDECGGLMPLAVWQGTDIRNNLETKGSVDLNEVLVGARCHEELQDLCVHSHCALNDISTHFHNLESSQHTLTFKARTA